jgi:hypothetical protein
MVSLFICEEEKERKVYICGSNNFKSLGFDDQKNITPVLHPSKLINDKKDLSFPVCRRIVQNFFFFGLNFFYFVLYF